MKVADIRQQSGVYVISSDNAKRHLHVNQEISTQKKLKARLHEPIHAQEEANREIQAVFDKLVKNYETPLPAEKSLPNYGVRVPTDSQVASVAPGIATTGFFIGAGVLGMLIWHGIQTRNTAMLLMGAIPVSAMAVLFGWLFGKMERRVKKNRT